MPETMDKNWFQIIVSINGFRASYGQWPTKIRLPQDVPDTLAEGGLLVQLQQKLRIQFDGSPFITEDDQGRTYCVLEDGFIANTDIDARTWLGLDSGQLPPREPAKPVQSAPPQRQAAPVKPERTTFGERTQITEPHPKPKDKSAQAPVPRQTLRPEMKGKAAVKPKASPKAKAKQKTKTPRKNNVLATIIVSEIVLVIAAIAVTMLISILTYDGHCISFDTPVICSMGDYLTQVVLLMPYGAWVIGIQYWWAVLALVILFPFIGLLLAGRRARKRAAREAGEG